MCHYHTGATGLISVPQLEHSDPKGKEIGSYVGSALLLLSNYMHLRAIKEKLY